MQSIADRAHLCTSHLSRLFHRQTGETITTFLNQVRLEEAKRLLLSTQMNVSEICYAVGYRNLSPFTRTFKNRVGMEPK